MTKKATEAELSELHGIQVKVATLIFKKNLEFLEDEDPSRQALAMSLLSPALISAVTNILKQNNITADPADSTELDELGAQLENIRSRRKATILHMKDVAVGD